MRVLVLGGSWFVGRVVVEAAVGRGHAVTVFNRGRSPVILPAGVEAIRGDRERDDDVRGLACQGPWDVVVDVSGAVPATVARSAKVLTDVAESCVFVSTISVYRDWPHAPVDESSPVWDADPGFDPGTRRWNPEAYGPLKRGCELACREAFGEDRLLIVRPQVVLGRYEYVGRLPWWLGRMRRGGQVLAPGPDRCIQPVDVRDLAGFLLDQVERGRSGIFNVAAPPDRATYGGLLRACMAVTAAVAEHPVELVWVDEDWLFGQGVRQWTELPLWRHAAAAWGMCAQKALEDGLRCRPLTQTVADAWAWLHGGGQPVDHERFAEHGISPAREAALIRQWLVALSDAMP
jgi:2'-hydroxyisoflavone reductase